jgi:hypothetical protein
MKALTLTQPWATLVQSAHRIRSLDEEGNNAEY